MTATMPSRPLLGAKRTPWVPYYNTDIRRTFERARRLQSLQQRRTGLHDSADEAMAMRQIEADQQAAGYVPAPAAPDFNTLPF